MSNELEDFIKNNRDAFETRTPDPAVLGRIQEQMRGAEKKQGILIPMKMLRWAAACIVILAGATIFFLVQDKPATTTTIANNIPTQTQTQPSTPDPQPETLSTQQPVTTPDSKLQTPDSRSASLNMSEERKDVLFAQLNDMESPSQRLAAAMQTYEFKNTDKDIVDALVKTMNSDPNTNVRLAALDALSRFHRESYVKQQLVSSLSKQKDPMVQIGLIQLLTRMKQTTILKELDKIVKDDNTLKAVKDQAYTGIFTLRS